MHKRTVRILAGVLALTILSWIPTRAAEPVTITVTDKVLVPEVKRLGINLCSDNYWDCAMLKMRAAENFEGVRYRMVTWGPQMDEHGLYAWFWPSQDPTVWEAMKGKVRYTILGGPDKEKTGFIKEVRAQVCPADQQKRKLCYIEFDQPVTPLKQDQIGILMELDRPDQGSIRDTNNPDVWNTLGNTAHLGDVPPGSFGNAALWLKGTDKQSHYMFVPGWSGMMEIPGKWHVRLWTKVKSGSPKFQICMGGSSPGGCVRKVDVPVNGEWKKYDLVIELPEGAGDKKGQEESNVFLVASGGDVLVDDVEIWKEEPSRNPTAFRDLVVDPLKKLQPGILRYLQMGGSDLETNFRPALKQMGWTRDFGNLVKGGRNDASNYPFNLHEFYVLCEYVGADPWYCLPGTIHPEEMKLLMEYLGAPADVGYGKVRAELGHPQPWTKVFKNIYIEIGNEAWNPSGYATGSYNGPSHWQDLFATAKASPHYDKRTLFVAGAQASSPSVAKRVLTNAPNADRVAVAPYMIHHLKKSEVEPLDSDDKLFQWVFGFADWRVNDEKGEMRRNYQYATELKSEVSIYEHNYHITSPSVKEDGAPIELRNKIIASLGGGLNLINDSLHMLRDLKVRSQCLFNLNQKQFREGVKLWGFMPGLSLKEPRYRPSYLAMEIANHVIAGDLIETTQAKDEPAFTAHGIMEWPWGKKPEFADYGPLPTLRSYAFKDGAKRGLILVNLDTKEAHTVKLALPGTVKCQTAHAWRLAAEALAANNEYETGAPQVKIAEEDLKEFDNGSEIKLPAHSMMVLQWEVTK